MPASGGLVSADAETAADRNARFERIAGSGRWRSKPCVRVTGDSKRGIRSPLDAAILRQAAADVTGYRKIDFDFERRRLSVVVEAPDSAGRRLLITKGAPEPILATASKPAVRFWRSTRRHDTCA
jgi:magnesium-transporting ATPase (P-type)